MSMESITLPPRLLALANRVKKNSHFADIGTDHGYLPLYLIEQKQITTAIASDIKEGPLDSAKHMAEKYKIPLDLRLSSGLLAIKPEEVDCVAIAGMGGMTIAQILQEWTPAAQWQGTYLLQPMSTQKELRLWLSENHFTVDEEETVCEGNLLYTIMVVRKGEDNPYDLGELLYGRQSPETRDPNRHLLLNTALEKTEKILEKLPQTPENHARKTELEQQREMILHIREEWLLWQQQ